MGKPDPEDIEVLPPETTPLDLMPQESLARRWGKSVRSLQRWRREGIGPAWIQIGNSCFYRLEDILAFENSQRRSGPRT